VVNAITVGKMSEEDFRKWPLFRELRQDSDYEERIRVAFSSIQKDSDAAI
jgi:hypothetical protein